ncbi:MAG: hypothetical protein ACYCPH_03335 [Minisyncoccota bacterium]
MHPERIPGSKNPAEYQPNIASVTRLLSTILERMEMKNEHALIELLPDIKEKIEALREAQENLPGAVNIRDALLKLYNYREKIEAMQKS